MASARSIPRTERIRSCTIPYRPVEQCRQHNIHLPDPSSLEIGPTFNAPTAPVWPLEDRFDNSIFNFSTRTWTPASDFPNGNDMADAPCALLPNDACSLPRALVFLPHGLRSLLLTGTTFTQAPPTRTSTDSSHPIRNASWGYSPTGQVLSLVANGIPNH